MRTPDEVERLRSRGGLLAVDLIEQKFDEGLLDRFSQAADGSYNVMIDLGHSLTTRGDGPKADTASIEQAADRFRAGGWTVVVQKPEGSARDGSWCYVNFKRA